MRPPSARVALVLSLAIAWLNFLLTARWAQVPGSLHGWRMPWYAAALAIASVLAVTMRLAPRPLGRLLPGGAALAGAGILAAAFFCWFPPPAWTQVPFLDNWPPRYQSTLEGIALLQRGAASGWQWAFLGGYHIASDITQNLAVLGFVPILVFGPEIGFHLLHLLLFASIPLLVFLDLRSEDEDVASLAAGISCLMVGVFSYMFMRSGDTNSVAGVACTALAVFGIHAARRGSRLGLPLLVIGLTLTACSHAGFLVYAVVYLALDAIYYRDVRSAGYSAAALAVALVVSLPFTWELWRYPAYFSSNNLGPGPRPAFEWRSVALNLFYGVELLFQPGRWSNDYSGLATVFLPVIALVSLQRRSRVGFHATAVVATLLMLRLNMPQFGYLFWRPMHMFAVFTAAPLAWFILRRCGSRPLALALLAVVGLYLQITFQHVPHVPGVRSFDAALVDRVSRLDGALVLLENNPHLNMNAAGGSRTERSAFGVHFESMLPAVTHKRFYAGYWDGWQWSAWRTNVLAGGAFQGRPIAETPHRAFADEMRRWGVVHVLTWSVPARAYLDADPDFQRVWASGQWIDYQLRDPDPRAVVTRSGRAELAEVDPLGARVELTDARAGDEVVVRTNFFPAWSARDERGRPVDVFDRGGQVAFRAPASGRCTITLVYPRRIWLGLAALLVLALALVVFDRLRPSPARG